MGQYFILKGCKLEGLSDFFASQLSDKISDYPDGIVMPIEKPYRWTSADVVRKIKFQLQKHFHEKNIKVGHAGTLDPLATGLLVICIGKATKISEELQSHEKEYIATIEFGATTPSFDLEQEIDHYYPYEHITKEVVEDALKSFLGEQEQVPPLFSAKMVGGLRAYEYARAGEQIELRQSHINISELELLDFSQGTDVDAPCNKTISEDTTEKNTYLYQKSDDMQQQSPRPRATIRIRCSKGTYIRSLARDLGVTIGSGGYLASLIRTASGDFSLSY